MSTEFSAGGVVVRGEEVVVVVPLRRDGRGRKVLGLPKGHPDGAESAEAAAVREVREEAGVEGDLIAELGDVAYTYERHGRRIDKTVRFFLFRYRSGDPAEHDHEIEQACWMGLEQAESALTYAGEREMISRARSLLAAGR